MRKRRIATPTETFDEPWKRIVPVLFLYDVRAYDLYRRPVMSLAVLADTDPGWRPAEFGYGFGKSATHIRFEAAKLLDFQEERLGQSDNPFGLAVLAHLKTQQTRGDAEDRLAWKVRLARMLYDRAWTEQQVDELSMFLDWIMTLPEPLEERFEIEYRQMENEATMAETKPPIIRRAEARGEERGIEIGEQRGIEIGEQSGKLEEAQGLLLRLGRKRLGEPGADLQQRISAIQDRELLEQYCERIYDIESWEELLSNQ